MGGNCLRLILVRQKDGAVGEIEADFRKRKVGIFDLLGEHHAVIAVIASEDGGLVRINGKSPYLEFHGGNCWLGLAESDFINQPVGSAMLGDELRAFGIKDIPR